MAILGNFPGIDPNEQRQQQGAAQPLKTTSAPMGNAGAANGAPGPTGSSAPAAPTSGGAPASSPGQGSGFVGLQQLINANGNGGQAMANNLLSQAKGLENKYNSTAYGDAAADPNGTSTGPAQVQASKANAAQNLQDFANNTGSFGGLQSLLTNTYANPMVATKNGNTTTVAGGGEGYTEGQSELDAALAGQAGGKAFQGLQSQFGGLTQALDNGQPSPNTPAGKLPAPKANPGVPTVPVYKQPRPLGQRPAGSTDYDY